MATQILKVLTELTSLTPTGVIILKPFRPWFGIPLWRDRNVGIRVLNAQEIQQALETVSDVATAAQDQALKQEIVTRSLWSIDGAYVASKEDLDEYNKLHSTTLTEIEYKRVFVASFEQYLIDYLYTVYTELQKKQVRKVFGLSMCAVCKNQESKVPDNAHVLNFDVAEMICAACFSNVTEEDGFIFSKPVVYAQAPTVNITLDQTVNDDAPDEQKTLTPADFPTLDDYRNYVIEQAEKNTFDATQVQQ